MKRLDQQLLVQLFHMHKANSTESDAATGIERMNQFVFALARLQLIVHHPKHVRTDMFEFELCMVANPEFAIDVLSPLCPSNSNWRDDVFEEVVGGTSKPLLSSPRIDC